MFPFANEILVCKSVASMTIYKISGLLYAVRTEGGADMQDMEKYYRKQREKKAAIVIALRRREKEAAKHSEVLIKKSHENVSRILDKHQNV